MTPVVLMLGAVFGLGIATLIVALRPVAPHEVMVPRQPRASIRLEIGQLTMRLAIGLGVAVVVGVVTRWPMAALLLGIAGFLAPSLLGGGAERHVQLNRIEAIASWAEMLRDTLAGAGGLEQSILATAAVAPQAIRPEVMRLAGLLERERLAPSLRHFAEDLNDPAGDLVVAALVLAADKNPKRLGDLLGRLAQLARSEVNMRLRIETSRARTRTSVKVIIGFTLGFAVFLLIFSGKFMDAYDSALGQAMLGVVGACFGGAFWWLSRSFQIHSEDRFLRTEGMGDW
jgi:tight adherence protein B